ncbi:hypothetical protein B0H15DRAFT_807422 [Mycena belliarum]|uniref:Uncharacterized protein n=1 Tax=Mycena belliarum TaxID=1033014 RepID=A0AAD6XDR5_9AGAR|nr:hypothetical protein B0H15DRAFT_807422 [Mycena belliae]
MPRQRACLRTTRAAGLPQRTRTPIVAAGHRHQGPLRTSGRRPTAHGIVVALIKDTSVKVAPVKVKVDTSITGTVHNEKYDPNFRQFSSLPVPLEKHSQGADAAPYKVFYETKLAQKGGSRDALVNYANFVSGAGPSRAAGDTLCEVGGDVSRASLPKLEAVMRRIAQLAANPSGARRSIRSGTPGKWH